MLSNFSHYSYYNQIFIILVIHLLRYVFFLLRIFSTIHDFVYCVSFSYLLRVVLLESRASQKESICLHKIKITLSRPTCAITQDYIIVCCHCCITLELLLNIVATTCSISNSFTTTIINPCTIISV